MRQRGVAQQVTQPGDADPPGAQVLVPVDARARLRLRVVEMEHDQPLEPDPRVELEQEGIDGGGVRDVDPGRPRVGRVEADAEPPSRDAARSRRVEDVGELRDVRPEGEPAAGRVLEDDHRGVGAVIDLGEGQRQAIGQTLRAGRDARRPDATRRARSRTGRGSRAPPAARSRAPPIDRPNRSSSGPARFTRYEAWIATGPMSSSARRVRNACLVRGRLGSAAPGGRIVAPDLEGAAPRSRTPGPRP